MPAFRCTAKLLKELGTPKPELLEESPHDWHANLLRFGPKKFVLFCSTSTLFACLTPPVTRPQIRQINHTFTSALEAAMLAEGFSNDSIMFCKNRYSKLGVSKTYDRSVLGTMNDYLFQIDSIFWHAGGFEHLDFGMVSKELNRIPQVKRDFFCASDAFKKSLIRSAT